MKCPVCQYENPPDKRFCGNCGTQIRPLEDISASQTKTAQTPPEEIDRGTVLASRYEIIELLGRGGMGNVYEARFVSENNPEDLDKMEELFLKSYQIEPDLAEAHVGLGWTYFHKENSDRAFECFKKAYEKDPDNPDVNLHVASLLRDMHLNQRAFEFYLKAIEFDPASVDYRDLCSRCYLRMGEFEKAAVIMEEALELEPDDMRMRLFYARLLIMLQEFDKAERIVDQVEILEPKNIDIPYTRAWLFAIQGEKGKSLKIINQIEKPVYFSTLPSNVYAILDMKDEAIRNIEDAIAQGMEKTKSYPYHYRYLMKNPFYDSLRGDPRFQKIVKKQEEFHRENLKKFGDI